MSLEETLAEVVRKVVREELERALAAAPAGAEPDLVPLGDVRQYVQVSKSTLKRWIAAGTLEKHGQGRLTRVKLADVRAALDGATTSKKQPKGFGVSADAARILKAIEGGKH